MQITNKMKIIKYYIKFNKAILGINLVQGDMLLLRLFFILLIKKGELIFGERG